MPRVTVCIPTYNRSQRLRPTVESVLGQTYSDWELVIVDDGSTDDTWAVAREFEAHPEVRCVRQQNGGHSEARNHGLRLAQGEYLAYLDHDDRWSPRKLELQVEYLDAHRQSGLVYCRWELISDSGEVVRPERLWEGEGSLYKPLLIHSNFMKSMSVPMMRTELVRRVGGFRHETDTADDLDLFLRLALLAPFGHLPEALVGYNVGNEEQQSRNSDRVQRAQWSCLRQCFQRGRPRFSRSEMEEFRARWGTIYSWFLRQHAREFLRAGKYREAWSDYRDLLRLQPAVMRDRQLMIDVLSLAKRSLLASLRPMGVF